MFLDVYGLNKLITNNQIYELNLTGLESVVKL